ncbi:MAG: hypothetical protein ABII00_13775 [Elusimicrobiota bacterium]
MTGRRSFEFTCPKCKKKVRESAGSCPDVCGSCAEKAMTGFNGRMNGGFRAPAPSSSPSDKPPSPARPEPGKARFTFRAVWVCERCGGTGRKYSKKCPACDGKGAT